MKAKVEIRCLLGFMFLLTILTWIFTKITLETGIHYNICRESNQVNQESLSDDFYSWNHWDNVTGFPSPIVPNIVHFIKFRKHEVTFVELVVILSAWCHQQPDRLIIHCDCDDLTGSNWGKIKALKGVEVHRIQEPTEVFGKNLSSKFGVYHAGDIARIAVLRQYGGIALDLDTYVVRSLDEFRKFECSVGWPIGAFMGCQIIVAHKKSRFIQLYGDSYHSYNASSWYYNAGQLPSRIMELLPHIVHRVPWKFGVHDLRRELYLSRWKEWRSYYSIHLLIRHRYKKQFPSNEFDEHNIRTYNFTFGEMARLVLFGSTDLIHDDRTIDWEYSRCRQ